MKAPSLKLDKDAIASFLLAHGEKFVVALVALGAAGLAWSGIESVRTKSVQTGQTPEAIRSVAADAARHIDAVPRPTTESGRKAGQLAGAIDPWRPQQVKVAGPEKPLPPLDRPLYQELAKRTKPEVFPIEDLRAVAGIALVADDAAAARAGQQPAAAGGDRPATKLAPFVIVTGLVPADRQTGEFRRRFSATALTDAESDRPYWGVYQVERMVVTPGAKAEWQVVFRSQPRAGGGDAAQGERGRSERGASGLPAAFELGSGESESSYVAPLPLRVDDPWGTLAVHPWFTGPLRKILDQGTAGEGREPEAVPFDIRRLLAAPRDFVGKLGIVENAQFVGEPDVQRDAGLVAHEVRIGDEVVPVGDVGTSDRPVFVIGGKWAGLLEVEQGLPVGAACRLKVRVEQVGPTPAVRILAVAPGGDAAREKVDPDRGPLKGAEASVAGQEQPGEAAAEFRLFRFVDTDVKPGQQYRYRVKLTLRNPNVGLDQRYLSDPALAKGQYLISKESNESEAVGIPDPMAVLVRTLSKSEIRDLKLKPGSMEVLVLAPARDASGYVLRGLLTEPGGLVNVDRRLNRAGETRTRGEEITTDRILVDVRGRQEDRADQPKSDRPPEPLEALVLRPDGSFEFVSAADGQRQVSRHVGTLFAPAERKATPAGSGVDAFNPFGSVLPPVPPANRPGR